MTGKYKVTSVQTPPLFMQTGPAPVVVNLARLDKGGFNRPVFRYPISSFAKESVVGRNIYDIHFCGDEITYAYMTDDGDIQAIVQDNRTFFVPGRVYLVG